MRAPRILIAALCASTLALAASGCGSSGTSYSGAKPDAWAANVCGALSDWAKGLQAGSKTLSTQLGGAKDLPTVKAKFVSFLENAGTSADTMISKVKAVGPPAVKNGASLQRDLETGLERARASFTHAITKAKALPTSGRG